MVRGSLTHVSSCARRRPVIGRAGTRPSALWRRMRGWTRPRRPAWRKWLTTDSRARSHPSILPLTATWCLRSPQDPGPAKPTSVTSASLPPTSWPRLSSALPARRPVCLDFLLSAICGASEYYRTMRRRIALIIGIAGGALVIVQAQTAPPRATSGLTAVDGLRVGHHTLAERPTGCTVVLVDGEAVGGVAQMGGAPGTRETDLLHPLNMVDKVNAVVLSGGSAFGLDAATGVVRWLDEHNIGWPTAGGKVPIVPAAILFDLSVGGNPKIRPTADCGYKAAAA